MAFRTWRKAYRRHKECSHLCNEVLKIARKYQSYWPAHAIQGVEGYFLHGEAALALEGIFSWLYEARIEPTEEEKRLLVKRRKSKRALIANI